MRLMRIHRSLSNRLFGLVIVEVGIGVSYVENGEDGKR